MKRSLSHQVDAWSGDFGRDYTDRCILDHKELQDFYLRRYGLSRCEMNERFLAGLPKSIKILDVGTNAGNEILCLKKMGFHNLYGIDVQRHAVKRALARVKGSQIVCAEASDIPYDDGFFDLVVTTGVLIHIPPPRIPAVLSEIHRVSRRHIWGLEYYSPRLTEIPYRGKKGMLWKTDFAKLYRTLQPDLSLVKERHYRHIDGSGNIDTMFLLEKR